MSNITFRTIFKNQRTYLVYSLCRCYNKSNELYIYGRHQKKYCCSTLTKNLIFKLNYVCMYCSRLRFVFCQLATDIFGKQFMYSTSIFINNSIFQSRSCPTLIANKFFRSFVKQEQTYLVSNLCPLPFDTTYVKKSTQVLRPLSYVGLCTKVVYTYNKSYRK